MTSLIYGYARVSTKQQELNRQIDILKKYNCDEILTEKISWMKSDRPELNRLKDKVRKGDTVVVESFSRLGRSRMCKSVSFIYMRNVRFSQAWV